MSTSQKTVLITGFSGFVGAHVGLAFLEKGWKIRGTTRTQEKADKLRSSEFFKKYTDSIEIAIVKDVVDGDFTEALKGVDAVAHIASPFSFSEDKFEDYAYPAVHGTTNILEAAAKVPSVKHVVVTSSFASVGDFSKPATAQVGKVYTEADWNPVTWEAASKTDNKGVWYCASKTLAEHAARDVQKKTGASYTLSTICPPMIFGPIVHSIDKLDSLNESSGQMWKLISGSTKEVAPTPFPHFADVREVADAHVVSTEKGLNERFLIVNGEYDDAWAATYAKENFSAISDRVPTPKADQSVVGKDAVFILDGSKAEKELGLKYRSREETFGDMFKQYLELEKAGL